VTLTSGPPIRALMLVLVLALAGSGLFVLNRARSSNDDPAKTDTPKQTPRARPSSPAPPAARVAPSKSPAVAAPSDRLPAAIEQGLSTNHVVVVVLFDPRAKIDDTAVREAQAGAQLAGTRFVPVDVTKDEVDALNARYGVIQDPAVLVLRPPGDLVVRIDGFADRDTVAQAAANAAS
jgi:hypothetical protein